MNTATSTVVRNCARNKAGFWKECFSVRFDKSQNLRNVDTSSRRYSSGCSTDQTTDKLVHALWFIGAQMVTYHAGQTITKRQVAWTT